MNHTGLYRVRHQAEGVGNLRERLQRFLREGTESRGISPSTVEAYGRDLRQFIAFLETQGIAGPGAARPHHVTAHLHRLRSAGRAPSSVARAASAIRAFFRYLAVELREIDTDPAAHIRMPKTERKVPRILTAEETARLLEAPNDDDPYGMRDRAILELVYATGIRAGELIGLDIDHVNPDLGYVRCSGADGRERFIPLGRAAAEALRRYLSGGRPKLARPDKPESALFLGRRGTRLTRQSFWKIVKKYAAASGIDGGVHPHALRHSFAAHLIEGGADLRAVQEMLGHKDMAATQRYVKHAKPSLKDVYESAHPRAR